MPLPTEEYAFAWMDITCKRRVYLTAALPFVLIIMVVASVWFVVAELSDEFQIICHTLWEELRANWTAFWEVW